MKWEYFKETSRRLSREYMVYSKHLTLKSSNLIHSTGLQIRGGKGYFSIDFFWNAALKIKLKGENTLCILRFQC